MRTDDLTAGELAGQLWREKIEERLDSLEEKELVGVHRRLGALEKQKLKSILIAATIAGFSSSVVTALILKWVTGFG